MAEFGGRCWRAMLECDTELLLIYKKHERQTAILLQSSLIQHILQCTIFSQQTQKKGKETFTVLKLHSGNLIVHKALEFDSSSFKILSLLSFYTHTHNYMYIPFSSTNGLKDTNLLILFFHLFIWVIFVSLICSFTLTPHTTATNHKVTQSKME